MKYIEFKSNKFGNMTINLSEALERKPSVINESFTKTDIAEIERIVNHSIIKQIEQTVKKELKSKATENDLVEIVSNCLTQLYKQLWTKRSFWKAGIKNVNS